MKKVQNYFAQHFTKNAHTNVCIVVVSSGTFEETTKLTLYPRLARTANKYFQNQSDIFFDLFPINNGSGPSFVITQLLFVCVYFNFSASSVFNFNLFYKHLSIQVPIIL